MNKLIPSRKAPIGLLFTLALIFAVPAISLAQGRGNGRGQGGNLDKKCAKFVNCHDARDGRWDGRGPAINPNVIPVNQPPIVYPNPRGQNNQIYYPRSRNSQVRRDDDDDNNRTGTWRRRRHDPDDTDPNNQNDRWRRRRSDGTRTETRDRRIRQRDRSNIIGSNVID